VSQTFAVKIKLGGRKNARDNQNYLRELEPKKKEETSERASESDKHTLGDLMEVKMIPKYILEDHLGWKGEAIENGEIVY